MSEENEPYFTVPAKDVSAVPKAPDLAFFKKEDRWLEASPVEGDRIRFGVRADVEDATRITFFAHVEVLVEGSLPLRMVIGSPYVGAGQRDLEEMALCVACGMYWSIWRARKLREMKEGADA